MKKIIKDKIFLLLFFIVLFSCYKNDYEDPLLIKARKNYELQKNYLQKKIHFINNTKRRIFFKKETIKKDFYFETKRLDNNKIDIIFISGTLNNKIINKDNEEVKNDIAYIKEIFNKDYKDNLFLKNDKYKSDVKIYKSFFKNQINNEPCTKYNYKFNYSDKLNLKIKGNCWINNENGLILKEHEKSKMRGKIMSLLPQKALSQNYYFYNKNLELKKIKIFSKVFFNILILKTVMRFEIYFEDFEKIN